MLLTSTTNNDNGDLITLPFDVWLKQLCVEQPQADYWFKSMELDLLNLQFVKSFRTADFSLYMETLDSLIPWVFVLDHTHYARNLPIHLRDMATLEERHPALYVKFKRGHFMGQKSRRAFSNIPRDQMHEQLIDWLKNHADVIENLDDPSTVHCEQLVRPEMARLVREFEGTDESDERMLHEQYSKFQSDYKSGVIALVNAFEQLGNPFFEDSGRLLDLHQSILMPSDVVDNVRIVKDIGLQQYTIFLNKRVSTQEEAFTATLHKFNLKLFKASLSEPRRKSDIGHQKPTSENYPDYVGSQFWSHHQQRCILPRQLYPRLLGLGVFTMETRVRSWTAFSLMILTIRDQWRQLLCWMALFSFKCFVLEVLWPSDVFVPYILSWFERNNRVEIV